MDSGKLYGKHNSLDPWVSCRTSSSFQIFFTDNTLGHPSNVFPCWCLIEGKTAHYAIIPVGKNVYSHDTIPELKSDPISPMSVQQLPQRKRYSGTRLYFDSNFSSYSHFLMAKTTSIRPPCSYGQISWPFGGRITGYWLGAASPTCQYGLPPSKLVLFFLEISRLNGPFHLISY